MSQTPIIDKDNALPKNLNEALNAAKTERKVLSKLIIWESGVSKTQFYRIIKGQEAPSPETKARMAKSLGIDSARFDALHNASKSEPVTSGAAPTQIRTMIIGGVVLLVGAMAVILLFADRPLQNDETPAATVVVADKNDKTLFIKDVTIPDGTSIPVNTRFVKTWRVKNIGTVPWKNRYLMRQTPASNLICSSPAMVPIPETLPGETVDISVTFMTPHLPGSCRTDWKTADNRGNLYYPDMHGLFSIVVVTE